MQLTKRINIPDDWYKRLRNYIESEHFSKVANHIKTKREEVEVFPPSKEIFRAFQLTPLSKVSVVVIGMDPYPTLYKNKPVACGLSFAPRDREYVPPSLRKIYDRIKEDFYDSELTFAVDLDIEYWAKQGILMLNAALTVEQGKPGSHIKVWELWTKEVIKALNEHTTDIIFCLWGKDAQAFKTQIADHHVILESEHPVAANYQGRPWNCNHFIEVNKHLEKANLNTINWIKT